MNIKIPAIMLVRGGSKRLPDKWAKAWGDSTLLRHAIQQCEDCEAVSDTWIGSDDYELSNIADDQGAFYCHRPEVSDDQTSMDGLAYVLDTIGLQASYVLLVQCTAPFINPTDLERLILLALDEPSRDVWALCKDTRNPRPSGMAWVVPPFAETLTPTRWVQQDAPDIDIDTQSCYDEALRIKAEIDNGNMEANWLQP